ncbi:MAG: stage 0 sporulation protein J, partial [Leptotrichiaceae bacterium]
SYRALMDVYNHSQEEIAIKIGKTRSSISNKLRLLKLTDSIKEYVKNGNISYGHARTLLALESADKIEKLAKDVMKNGISVRKLEEIVKKENTNGKQMKINVNEVNNSNTEIKDQKQYLEDKLREYFGTKTEITDKKIEIEFYDYEDLERILSLLDIEFN